jgi:hypoxanthine phosphoribosyltransferase
MANLEMLFPRQEIDMAVNRLAEEISRNFRDKNPLVLGVLKGSFIFLADLVRRLEFPLEIDFVSLSSYKNGVTSSGEVKMGGCFNRDIKDRHIIVVEDIVDTGLTLHFLLECLRSGLPADISLCALLEKPLRRKKPVHVDYLGFTVPDRFIVGYGLDCAERYRNLPDIFCLNPEECL